VCVCPYNAVGGTVVLQSPHDPIDTGVYVEAKYPYREREEAKEGPRLRWN
jgi:hypothetical protein